jgi:archaellum component FlaG (FlaF/FlaG flagellin family)
MISIGNDDSNENPYNFSIRGTGQIITPEIEIRGNDQVIVDGDSTPSTIDHTDFGNANVSGGTVARTFTIKNTGNGTLSLTGSPRVQVSGTHASNFTVTQQPSSTVSANGGTTTFEVRFDPSASGTRNAMISIGNDDSNENPYNFSIRGTGHVPTAPEIDVTGIEDGDTTPDPGDGTDFGSVPQGTSGPTRTYKVSNIGNATLTTSGLSVPSGYTVTDGLSPSIAIGSYDTFTVRLDTSSVGTKSGQISFTNNDSDENPFNFAITGMVEKVIDLGVIHIIKIQGVANTGNAWYRGQASKTGFFTAEAFFTHAAGNINLKLYDAADLQHPVDSSMSHSNSERVDVYAQQGETYFLKVLGTNSDVDFRVANLVSRNGTTVTVNGTSNADTFTFNAGATHVVRANDVKYYFDSASVKTFQFNGGGDSDSIVMTGTAGADRATLRVANTALVGAGYEVRALGVENVTARSGGGADVAVFHDSAGADRYYARADHDDAWMTGSGFYNYAEGFDRNIAYASAGGKDVAIFHDSVHDDRYYARANHDDAWMTGSEFYNYADGFDRNIAYASAGGFDVAIFHDSVHDDRYYARANHDDAWMTGSEFYNYADGFDRNIAYASAGGFDVAVFHGSTDDDNYVARADYHDAWMTGGRYYNYAAGFDRNIAYALTGGTDRAEFRDSAGQDTYVARADRDYALMTGIGFYNYAAGFERNIAYSTTGNDTARLVDTMGDDRVTVRDWGVSMQGSAYYNAVVGFACVEAYGINGGTNTADVNAVDYCFKLIGEWIRL